LNFAIKRELVTLTHTARILLDKAFLEWVTEALQEKTEDSVDSPSEEFCHKKE
jgi:hypothetical protein